MTRYSYDKYGNFLYGAADTTSPYYQANIVAELVDYNTVRVSWAKITPDPSDSNPTYWALVKTLTGAPDSPYEGKIVTGAAITASNLGVTVDTTNSVSFATEWSETFITDVNVEVNYSLWVFNPSLGWINCGDSNAVVVDFTNTVDTISKWIPRAWQNSINGVGEAEGEYEFGDLLESLRAYSLEYDAMRIKTNLLELSNTPRYITSSLARTRQLDFGFAYEASLGDPYFRSLTYSGDKINSLKGTIQGISEYIVALTHIQNKVEIGHNLFLDYNDSSFEESLGQWQVNKLTAAGAITATATQVLYTAIPHVAPQPNITDTSSDAGSTPRSAGAMKVVTTAGAGGVLYPTSTTFSLDNITTTIVDNTTLIPVTAGLSYVFTGWMIGDPSTYSTVTPYIGWYDYSGKLISSTIANAVAMMAPKTVTSSWQEFNSGSDMGVAGTTMGVKAPVGTVFALPMLKVTGAGTTYFDMFQLAEHHYSIEYQDARQINIYLRGQEENILANPSFENATTSGWFANNAQLDVISNQANDGQLSMSILATADADLVTTLSPEQFYTGPIVYSDWMPVDPNISYTFTMYPNPTIGDFTGRIGIEFSSQATQDKQNAITGFQGSSVYYYTSSNYITTANISEAYYDAGTGQIHLVFASTPTGFADGDYISIKGLTSYPEMNVTSLPLSTQHASHSINYYVYVGTLANTPDGAIDVTGGFMTLMYFDTPSSSYEDLVTFANITEAYVDFTVLQNNPPGTTTQSVTAVAPPYSKDTGLPSARVYLMPDILTNQSVVVDGLRFSPTLLVDQYTQATGVNIADVAPSPFGGAASINPASIGDLVSSNNIKISDYFSGRGNATTVLNNINPLTLQYYDPKFCVWEKKIWYNFISNPYFTMNDMGWTALPNTTATYDSVNMVEYLNIPDNGLNGGIYTTLSLPHPALGGEDIVVTVTISGMIAGQSFSITSLDMTTPPYGNSVYTYNNSLITQTSNATQRISAVFQAVTGDMMGTIQLNVNTNGVGDANITIATASAEYGSTASSDINLANPGTFTLVNPMNPSMNLYAAFATSPDAGISSYITDLPIKFNRIFATIKSYLPNGSTFRITRGWPNKGITDLTESLVMAPSFEKDTGLWTGEQATLVRIPYAGRYLDLVTHGIAYGRVYANSLSQYETYFGIVSENIPIDFTKSYYGSVAVRPVNGTSAQGLYSLKVDAYKINDGGDILLSTFDNRAEFFTQPLPLPGTGFTTTTGTTPPGSPIPGDRWLDLSSATAASEYTWTLNGDGITGQWVENDENLYYTSGQESSLSAFYTFSATPPSSPVVGQRWFDTTSNIGYVWVDDQQAYDPDGTTPSAYTAQWAELAVVYTQNEVYLDEAYSPNWAYLNVLINKNDLQQISYLVDGQSVPTQYDADYVRVRVECTPDTYVPGQAFDVDRVVFRE